MVGAELEQEHVGRVEDAVSENAVGELCDGIDDEACGLAEHREYTIVAQQKIAHGCVENVDYSKDHCRAFAAERVRDGAAYAGAYVPRNQGYVGYVSQVP